MGNKAKKIVSLILAVGLLFQQAGFVQAGQALSILGYLSQARNSLIQPDKFRPVHLRYFSYDPASDHFKILLDKGDLANLEDTKAKEEAKGLLSYFLVGVALPDDAFWVNLRPDAEHQIIDTYLEKTDVGRIMLEADLQLKKDTASFSSPQTPEGKAYWDKLYKKAGELFGSENITIPTVTRPWIVPGEIIVREAKDSAYVYKAGLKVMLEEDYLSGPQSPVTGLRSESKGYPQYQFKDPRLKELNGYSTQLIKELIIPKLTKEVNSSKRYAPLRQVYYSLILSRWFKSRFSGKPGAYASLINTQNLTNLTSQEPWSKTEYFKQYQQSFAKGEYNLKEQVNTPTGQVIRSYVSGGLDWRASSSLNAPDGAVFDKDISNKLQSGIAINGIATIPTQVSMPPAVAASPLNEEYRAKLQPILKNKEEDVFVKIEKLDQKGELSKIFPIMDLLKKKIKGNVTVFDHTVGLIKELSLIEKGDFVNFTETIGRIDLNQTKVDEALFDKYRDMLKEIVENEEERELIYLIALLHDVGEAEKPQGHPQRSAEMIKPWLEDILSQKQIDKVEAVIRSHVDLGTLYFAERTPDYLKKSLGKNFQDGEDKKYLNYVKFLSILTLLDAGESITKKKAEFYAKIGEGSNVQEDFYERRLDQFCSHKSGGEDVLDENKWQEAVNEQKALQGIISPDEYESFKKILEVV